MSAPDLRLLVRDVPDFPRKGIVFKDITPLVRDPAAFGVACEAMAVPYEGQGVTHVLAIESRGFLFAGPVALHLGAGLVPVRKPGKLPWERVREEYLLEYGTDSLEMHRDAIDGETSVLIVDDVLATGGTALAAVRLCQGLGARIVGCSFLIELTFLAGRQRLGGTSASAVLAY